MKYLVIGILGLMIGCDDMSTTSTGGSGATSDTGGGGTGGVGGEGGGGQGGHGGDAPQCEATEDCPATPKLCHVATCEEGTCKDAQEPNGTGCKSLSKSGRGICVDGTCMGDDCLTVDDCTEGNECVITYCTDGACQYVQDTLKIECDGGAGQCIMGTCQQNECTGLDEGSPCSICNLAGTCHSGLCFQAEPGQPSCQ